ncbi:RNA polymerase sigma factor [Elongatibacter sediminis]|uniref:RNA polymerase sigma factor n=1 Tax=Elongatibacter sediminis TaxID=3119006 RepID=A0AAW9RFX9_9GAMM
MTDKASEFVETWFRERNQDLLRYLQRKGNSRAEAEDLAQEAYIRLLRVDRIDFLRNPQAYLFRIAANVAYEHRLKASRSEDFVLQQAPIESQLREEDSVEVRVDRGKRLRELERALGDLPHTCRTAFVLHKRDGLTYSEIATRMGISAHMVKKHMVRALSHCRETLRDTN